MVKYVHWFYSISVPHSTPWTTRRFYVYTSLSSRSNRCSAQLVQFVSESTNSDFQCQWASFWSPRRWLQCTLGISYGAPEVQLLHWRPSRAELSSICNLLNRHQSLQLSPLSIVCRTVLQLFISGATATKPGEDRTDLVWLPCQPTEDSDNRSLVADWHHHHHIFV